MLAVPQHPHNQFIDGSFRKHDASQEVSGVPATLASGEYAIERR
jgi:hypothetical protein